MEQRRQTMTTINVRVDEKIKKEASNLFEELGLDMSTAMNLFLRQAIMHGGLPFEVKKNNVDTISALDEVKKIHSGEKKARRYSNVDDLFDALNTEDE